MVVTLGCLIRFNRFFHHSDLLLLCLCTIVGPMALVLPLIAPMAPPPPLTTTLFLLYSVLNEQMCDGKCSLCKLFKLANVDVVVVVVATTTGMCDPVVDGKCFMCCIAIMGTVVMSINVVVGADADADATTPVVVVDVSGSEYDGDGDGGNRYCEKTLVLEEYVDMALFQILL